MNDIFLMLDGTLSTVSRRMLTSCFNPVTSKAFPDDKQPGDAVWGIRDLGTTNYGLVLLRGNRVVAVTETSHAEFKPLLQPAFVNLEMASSEA